PAKASVIAQLRTPADHSQERTPYPKARQYAGSSVWYTSSGWTRPNWTTATTAGTAPMEKIAFHGIGVLPDWVISWSCLPRPSCVLRPLSYRSTTMPHVIILGAGHNGLVASILLARAGLTVTVVEERSQVGGACKTEYPFASSPKLGCSTGAYLLGLMPPELMSQLGLELPLLRRDPHYFLPTTGKRFLLVGSDAGELRRQFAEFFSDEDWSAHLAMNAELAAIRDDLAPAWLRPPLTLEETAERFIRPLLRGAFTQLCRGSAREYLERFGFRSDLVKAMYAVTDAFSGLDGGYDTPGTGMNLLVHNMCRLPNSDGTWMIVQGGMGTVTRRLTELARASGASIRLGEAGTAVEVEGNAAKAGQLASGGGLRAGGVGWKAGPFPAPGW